MGESAVRVVARVVRACVFIFYALGSLLFYSPLLLLMPQLTLMFVNYALYRRYVDFVVGGWCDFMGALVGIILGCAPVLSGDNLTVKYPSFFRPPSSLAKDLSLYRSSEITLFLNVYN